MKKVGYCLIVLALVLSGLICGFLWGRNYSSDEPQLSGHISPAVSITNTNTGASGKTYTKPKKKININTATAEELSTLPGVGATLANRIVEYRKENGPFPSVEALTGVSGIGHKTLEDILQYITTGGKS